MPSQDKSPDSGAKRGEPGSEKGRAPQNAHADTERAEATWRQKQSQHIYHLRAQTGLTQKEFAAVVGWSTSQQSQIEQNAASVRIRPMHVMAARFVAEHPLKALEIARDVPPKARDKLHSYAEHKRDFKGA
jgi:DNA-binding transcriptional regulator YiaG